MSVVLAILRRELHGYLVTPLAYAFLIAFLVLSGFFTFYVAGFYERGLADLQPFFESLPRLYLFLLPLLSMGLWAEEASTGTLELLLSMPVSLCQAMLGKFLAAWLFLGVALGLTFPLWLTVNWLGHPDNGAIFTGYLGSWLLSGVYLAMGACLSTLSRRQVLAFILTVLVGGGLTLLGQPQLAKAWSGVIAPHAIDALAQLSPLKHFVAIAHGVLDLRDLIYFIVTILAWLAAGVVLLDINRSR